MRIILLPKESSVGDTPPIINGNGITYRGQHYDLSLLSDGGEVEAEKPFVGKIKRINGVIHATLQYRYCTDTAKPMQSKDISDYTFDIENGECSCPIMRKPEPEESTLEEEVQE